MLMLLLAAAEVSAAASGGSRGERRVEIVARLQDEEAAFSLGAAESGGPQAPQRQELLAGAENSLFKGELRVVPGSSGYFRAALEAGVHSGSLGLILGARTASLGRMQLRGLSARLEAEQSLTDEVRVGSSASVWALDLESPPSRDPWDAFGRATLDWPQRWEVGAWVSGELAPLSLAPAVAISDTPQGMAARGALAVEVDLGPMKLRVETGLQRIFAQELTLLDVSAGISLKL